MVINHWRNLRFCSRVINAIAINFCILFALTARAETYDYHLHPRNVAQGTWVFVGSTEDFSSSNGGNIVNTGFIVTSVGVLVIDTGPSMRYGQQMREAISHITDQPIVMVINTHHHPDHFLGNQAYAELPILALPEAASGEERDGGAFADNMYRMVGDWMRGTEPRPASQQNVPDHLKLGDHEIDFLRYSGHTGGDLEVFDRTTGVLFSGDLVFHDRAPTTPHASISIWLKSLDALDALPFRVLVPGHGQPAENAAPVDQTRQYLLWLDAALRRGVAEGLDMAEMLVQPVPSQFSRLSLVNREYQRSVSHLFPALERSLLNGEKP